ncbi:MAG: PAS domain S-box protein, partial [Ignavibacteriaceae bacterium]|nr:PAS domain S-box protein [Ignavibacteriaceae bacterium]
MSRKPTYEELERRVKKLEKEAVKRKKADRVHYQSKKTYQNILSSIEEGYYEVDLKGNLTFFNDSLCKIYGYARDELMGMNNRNYMTTETAKKAYEIFNRVYKTGKPTKIFDWKFIKKDGTKVDVEISVSLIRKPKGEAIGFRGIVRDVGERKLAEKKLRESEENFRTLAENANDGILIAIGDDCYAYANRHASEITGYSLSEVLKTTIKDMAHPDEIDKIEKIHKTIIEGKPFLSKYETMILRKDGKTIPIEVTSARSKWHGKPADINIIRDISERKRFEEELQESKAMFQAIVESLPFDVFALDRNNRYILQNSICRKNWGDLIGKSPENVAVDKNTNDLWLKNNRLALSGETVKGEVKYDRLNGDKNYYYNIISPIKGKEKIYGILGVLIDISEYKRVEEALRKSEGKYRRLFESLVDVFYQTDSAGRLTMVSPSIKKAAGYKPEEVIGSYLRDYYVNPDERKKFLELISTNGFVENFEVQMKKKDGSVLWASVNAGPSKDQEGNIVGVEGIARDITERINAEEELRGTKERFRNLTETISDWVWEVDKDSRYTYVNPKIQDILGYYPEEVIGKTPFDLMPTEEADRVSKIFDVIRVKKEPLHCLENINLHKNGHPVVLETSGIPIFDDDGEICGYRGVDRDITERKRIQEELQKAHDELECRVEDRTRELELQKSNLEEANIALQVLLDKRQKDKKELEDNVLTNVKEMATPYFEKIKKTKMTDQQKAILSILESYLNEIISPFARKMSMKYLNLTPTEI